MDGIELVRDRLGQVSDPVALLEGLFAYLPVGIQIYRADGHCLLTNRAFRELFGAEPPPEFNVLEDPIAEKQGFLHLIRRGFEGETITIGPVWYDAREQPRLRIPSGRRCAVVCTSFPLFDGDGHIRHVALVFKDVTAEMSAQEQAERDRDRAYQTQGQLQALLDNAPVIFFLKDLEGRHLLVSREAERAFGFPIAEIVGKTAPELFGGYAEVPAEHERIARERRAPYQALETLPQRGSTHLYFVTRFPTLNAAGQLTGTGGVAIDVNERMRAEERLRESEGRFSQVFRALPMAALIERIADRRFLDVNDAWERLTGYSRDEMLGKTSIELGLWRDPSQRKQLFDSLERDGVVRDFAATMQPKGAGLRDVLLSVDRMEIGGEPCLLLLAHDLTDYRRLERELRQSQKMEAIGRLAGGVAHDFNNILTAIRGANSLMLDQMHENDPRRRYAEQVERSTAKAASLTRKLLTFTRKQPLEPVLLDPNEVVRATVDMLQRMIGEDIKLETRLDARGAIKVDPGSLEQVLLNLAVNARDAMPDGGTLKLHTADVDGPAGELPAGEWVRICVEDTGVGMDAATRAHLFEPFFTTKAPGKGTGLGLSTVYGIVTQNGGQLRVESEPGRGSVFEVYLPRQRSQPPPAREPRPRRETPGGRETILLVEDDDEVRAFARSVLVDLGYRVLDARDGAHALALAEVFQDRIDLLVCDVVMPEVNGMEVARRIAEKRPTMKVLHISGYIGDETERVLEAGKALLQKPFDREGLAHRVRAILDGRS